MMPEEAAHESRTPRTDAVLAKYKGLVPWTMQPLAALAKALELENHRLKQTLKEL